MSRLFARLPPSMSLLVLSLLLLPAPAIADPATIPFQDCFNGNTSMKLAVDQVYAQVLDSEGLGTYLNLTVVGSSPLDIFGFTDSSSSLATLFTTTSVLTLNVWTNSTYLCNSLRPSSPLTPLNDSTPNYCPQPAGPFALSTSIPWGDHRSLTTLNTRLRAVDPFSQELLCLTVHTTPLDPGGADAPYGVASAIFWATVALAILYWLVIGIARIVSAWGRGITRPGRSIWSRGQSAGFILASAISGERFATTPALMRFSTPCLRDVLFHTQWCAALAMVAVQWPRFVYPLLVQTAWATLTYNITLANPNEHWNPLSTLPFNPPEGFGDQLADKTSPLFIDPNTPNLLFTLPTNATSGMSMFAYTLGVRPEDLFGLCIILFLGIVAATIVLSSLVWFIDLVGSLITGASLHSSGGVRRARSPGPKDFETVANTEESKSAIFRPQSRLALSNGGFGALRKPWYRMRTEISSFHGSVLHGNLVRILVLFHLPLTIFAVYEMTRPADVASVRSRALAALSFTVLSILMPVMLVVRVTLTTTSKLYDETRTLLALGPLYNHYRHGSQLFACLLFATNLVFGIVIGAGQKSGTAQAVVILVVEVAAALVTSIWLPWGSGASMGLISFLFCVARIVIAVLLVILSPAISIGDGSGAWVAYGILVILALVYLALALMLVIKLVEAVVRIVGRVGFDRSTHSVDSGLLGACGLLGCCGSRKRRSPRNRNKTRTRGGYAQAHNTRASEVSSTFVPPPPIGDGDGSSSRKGSFHSQQPPSVLRPEHALRPYREDSDDESGYIMGAWQPFPRPGYVPVKDTPPAAPTSGFSRVGGGRAHIDTPYAAITPAGESTQTLEWPAMDAARAEDEAPPMSVVRRQSPEAVSGGGVAVGPSGVPRGAMLPHMRTKSQTAIIEDAPILAGSSRSPSRAQVLRQQQQEQEADDDDDGESAEAGQQRRKKPWYHIRRHRPHSDGTPPPSSFPGQADQAAAATPDVPAGRSFVVIRKPQASPGRAQQLSTASTPTPTQSSFLTGHNSADVRASSATS
ncbi:membrane protein [Favolaschia claudopus]|uniref:Membrane protein n=1 Tax=Favolaschia claudopus TaxID=2862362 RepID=A0AAW0EB65_9AGAR